MIICPYTYIHYLFSNAMLVVSNRSSQMCSCTNTHVPTLPCRVRRDRPKELNIYKYFFGAFARRRLYTTYAAASNICTATMTPMKVPILGEEAETTKGSID